MTELSRRHLIKATAVAGAAVTLGRLTLRSDPGPAMPGAVVLPGAIPPAPSWVDRPTRWAQLTLVEDDPGKFDPAFWLDCFARTHSYAVCQSGGGCVAYYPTKIPLHHRSAWLGDRDVLGELIAGCRRLGMVVLARADPHATYVDTQVAQADGVISTRICGCCAPRSGWKAPGPAAAAALVLVGR